MKNNTGFTLIEMVVVVTVLGVIASIAIPSYSKSLRKGHEQDAMMQLTSIHAALKQYRVQTNEYPDTSSVSKDLAYINSTLGVNLFANGKTFSYTSDGTTFVAQMVWDEAGTNNDFTVSVNQFTINAGPSNTNPCCGAGNCPSLSLCIFN
jgi:prepilin-type N-terminal cleavage/methylation domain-containing protein